MLSYILPLEGRLSRVNKAILDSAKNKTLSTILKQLSCIYSKLFQFANIFHFHPLGERAYPEWILCCAETRQPTPLGDFITGGV